MYCRHLRELQGLAQTALPASVQISASVHSKTQKLVAMQARHSMQADKLSCDSKPRYGWLLRRARAF